VRRTSYKLGEEGSRRCRQEPRVRAPQGPAAELHCVTELGRGGPSSEEGRRFVPMASQFQPDGAPTGPEVLQIWPNCARTRRATLEPPSTSQRRGKGGVLLLACSCRRSLLHRNRRQQGVGGAPHCDRALPRASAAGERVGASPRASEAVLRVRALPRAAPPGDLELCRRRDSGGAGAARGAGVGRRRRREEKREEREERGRRGEERWG
jgi:hypothetical protein